MSDDKPRVWVYARMSTDQQEASIPIQLERCKAYIKMTGLAEDGEPTGVFRDPGVSGGKPIGERPAGAELMRRVRKGDHVVVATLDRMFRNSGDCSTTIERLTKLGVALHVTNMNGAAIDTSSPAGKFFVDVMGAAAEFDRSAVVDRMRRGRERAELVRPMRKSVRRFGLRELWSGPVGSDGRRAFRGYAVDEVEAELISIIVRMRRANNTWDSIRQHLLRLCRKEPRYQKLRHKPWDDVYLFRIYNRVLNQKAGLESPLTNDGRIPGDPDDIPDTE